MFCHKWKELRSFSGWRTVQSFRGWTQRVNFTCRTDLKGVEFGSSASKMLPKTQSVCHWEPCVRCGILIYFFSFCDMHQKYRILVVSPQVNLWEGKKWEEENRRWHHTCLWHFRGTAAVPYITSDKLSYLFIHCCIEAVLVQKNLALSLSPQVLDEA